MLDLMMPVLEAARASAGGHHRDCGADALAGVAYGISPAGEPIGGDEPDVSEDPEGTVES